MGRTMSLKIAIVQSIVKLVLTTCYHTKLCKERLVSKEIVMPQYGVGVEHETFSTAKALKKLLI